MDYYKIKRICPGCKKEIDMSKHPFCKGLKLLEILDENDVCKKELIHNECIDDYVNSFIVDYVDDKPIYKINDKYYRSYGDSFYFTTKEQCADFIKNNSHLVFINNLIK